MQNNTIPKLKVSFKSKKILPMNFCLYLLMHKKIGGQGGVQKGQKHADVLYGWSLTSDTERNQTENHI